MAGGPLSFPDLVVSGSAGADLGTARSMAMTVRIRGGVARVAWSIQTAFAPIAAVASGVAGGRACADPTNRRRCCWISSSDQSACIYTGAPAESSMERDGRARGKARGAAMRRTHEPLIRCHPCAARECPTGGA